jgi:hypothetical protein
MAAVHDTVDYIHPLSPGVASISILRRRRTPAGRARHNSQCRTGDRQPLHDVITGNTDNWQGNQGSDTISGGAATTCCRRRGFQHGQHADGGSTTSVRRLGADTLTRGSGNDRLMGGQGTDA